MSNLTLRIISALVLLPPILSLIFFAPPFYFAFVIILISALAGFEFAQITIGKQFPQHQFFVSGLSASISSAVCFQEYIPNAVLVALALTVPLCFVFFMFSTNDIKKALPASMIASSGALYCGALFGIIFLIINSSTEGKFWTLLLLGAAIFTDTFAFTFGKLFGKTSKKLAPQISPRKTWVGFFGGIFGSLVAVTLAKLFFIPALYWYDIPLLGASLSIFCQVGDLAESFLKRGFNVKDSGKIIPGHGGILDRLDSLMFGAPVILFYTFLR